MFQTLRDTGKNLVETYMTMCSHISSHSSITGTEQRQQLMLQGDRDGFKSLLCLVGGWKTRIFLFPTDSDAKFPAKNYSSKGPEVQGRVSVCLGLVKNGV